MNPIPLCVDLDGTLCRTDTLVESLLSLLKRQPWVLLALPFWLLAGRAAFKQRIASSAELNVARLPWRRDLLDWLRVERAAGTRLILCTGADRAIASACAEELGIFDEVLASDGSINLTGSSKHAALVGRFGERGYDYIGNSSADLPVWTSARKALLADATPGLAAKAAAVAELGAQFPATPLGFTLWLKALRVHQWVKNMLIFLPIALAQKTAVLALEDTTLGFLAFGLCASSVYVVNDLLDLESDRAHPRKSLRPFAAGSLPLTAGLLVAVLLLLLSFALAAFIAFNFFAVLAGYYCLTLAYSLKLKRMPIVDVLVLAALYTLRIIAGGETAKVTLSFWLLAFSVFLFLSLGIVKRYAEMGMVKSGAGSTAAGRGYLVDDMPLLRDLGTAAGYGAVLVLAMYLNSPDSQLVYHHPRRLWLLPPFVLYWISRIWLKTHRGLMHDDPIVFALKDGVSIMILAASVAAVVSASL